MKIYNKRFGTIVLVFGIGLLLTSYSQSDVLPQDIGGTDIRPGGVEGQAKARLREAYGKLPLSFEANQGQTDPKVKFLSRGSGYTLFLTDTEAILNLQNAEYTALHMKLVGANAKPNVSGLNELPGKVNYLKGNNPDKRRTNIPTYAKVQYADVYPGIDLVYYGHQRQLEYDLVVSPGAAPDRIKWAFEGAEEIELDPSGDLVLKISEGELRLKKPLVYQEVNGTRRRIAAEYVLLRQKGTRGLHVGVKVAAYDSGKPLIVDPMLSYSTYLGGSNDDEGYGIAVDGSGNAYVTGFTLSTDFPTASPEQSACFVGGTGCHDAFVTKLNAAGSALVYSTYLGGSSDDEG
ncbi:MAG TPA: SBBP repeat-containing protein, partial [Nitrospiria bacterium]|nr:SBBP repeat-containing protein [Nitrospiria bacterium]